MIVVMTSCAPVRALSNPGMNPQSAPPTVAARMARIRSTGAGRPPPIPIVTIVANNAPRSSWPSPPMLNMPARNEIATARPTKMYGIVATSVSVMGRIAVAMSLEAPVSSAVRIRSGSPNAPVSMAR
jgi:hypothetical protein